MIEAVDGAREGADGAEAGDGSEAFDELVRDLIGLLGRGVDASLPDEEFDEWALRVFRHQFATNRTYRSFCLARSVTPETISSWPEIPAVPTGAFKRLRLLSLEGRGEPEAVFRTSGTTRGTEERGTHLVPRLSLYRASLLPNFRAHLLPEGARLAFLSLIPDPRRAPESSLSRMVGIAAEELADGIEWLVGPDEGIRTEALGNALARAEADRQPVLVLSTAFGLVHAVEALEREGWRFELPEGSRLMETGGFKGRSRRVERDVLYEGVEDRMGVPPSRIVNEYGMTELLSQFYEPVLRGGPRHLVSPPWVRTRILDPATLEPRRPGEPGLLLHVDLANAGSVAGVLTEDMGRAAGEGGFRIEGRATGAEPRGCSRAMDELLTAAWG